MAALARVGGPDQPGANNQSGLWPDVRPDLLQRQAVRSEAVVAGRSAKLRGQPLGKCRRVRTALDRCRPPGPRHVPPGRSLVPGSPLAPDRPVRAWYRDAVLPGAVPGVASAGRLSDPGADP